MPANLYPASVILIGGARNIFGIFDGGTSCSLNHVEQDGKAEEYCEAYC